MYAGIDFSLNSTGACTIHRDGDIRFYSFPRIPHGKAVPKGLRAMHGHLEKVGVIIAPVYRRCEASKDNSTNEIIKVQDAQHLTHEIGAIVGPFFAHAAIEGVANRAKGSVADLAGYQYFMRAELLKEGTLMVATPSEVKKHATGKGNSDKNTMIAAFIALGETDPQVGKNGFWRLLRDQPDVLKNSKGEWDGPVSDLVDAYYLARYCRVIHTGGG